VRTFAALFLVVPVIAKSRGPSKVVGTTVAGFIIRVTHGSRPDFSKAGSVPARTPDSVGPEIHPLLGLVQAEGPDATVASGDAVDVVARLKEESGVPLRSYGRMSLNRALMAAGLVDRVQVTLFPVITGRTGDHLIFQVRPASTPNCWTAGHSTATSKNSSTEPPARLKPSRHTRPAARSVRLPRTKTDGATGLQRGEHLGRAARSCTRYVLER
jgi:hypothetical protein